MILHGDYTKAPRPTGILSNRVVIAVPWPTVSHLIPGMPGYLFSDTGSDIEARTFGVLSGPKVDRFQTFTFSWWSSGDGITAGSLSNAPANIYSGTSNITANSLGGYLDGGIVTDCLSTLTSATYGTLWADVSKLNWIAWSDVGSLDFTQSRKNVAGAMPMDWNGSVYGIQKLGKTFVTMGENGVSVITPVNEFMSLNTIHKIGLLGRDAFAGNDSVLYFIDKLGCLYQLTDTLRKLDYREYLLSVTTPTLTFDESTNFLYICNGTKGYVYSQESDSFGAGPVNITGSGYKSGVLYLTSPAAIATPVFEICTDIFDFGTRNIKTVYNLDFGTDSSGIFQAAVEYRREYDKAFVSTTWKNIQDQGSVKIVCNGSEFRFKFKVTTYKSFELDYFNVDYKVHAH